MNEQQIKHYKHIEELLSKAQDVERRSPEEALKIAQEALVLSERHKINETIAKSWLRIGRCYWIKSEFDQAIHYLSLSLELATKIEHHETKAEALIGLGNVYITRQFSDQALSYYNTALNLTEEKRLDEQQSKLFNNLGTLHEDLKNFETALVFYQKGYDVALKTNNDYAISIAYLNMGNAYLYLGKLDIAYENINRAYDYAIKFNQTLLLAHSYYSFGQYYRKTHAYQRSIESLKKGIKSAEDCDDFYVLVRIYLELANAYHDATEVKKAKTHFEQAYALAKQLDSIEFMPHVHEQLVLFYEHNDFKEETYYHYKAYFDVSQMIQENRRIERIKNIEFQEKLKHAMEETQTYKRLTTELTKNFNQMQVLSNIGRSMTATHDLNDIFKQLYDNVNQLMVADTLALGFYNPNTQTIDMDLYIERNMPQDSFSLALDNQTSLSVYCFLNQETIHMNDVRKEHKSYTKGVSTSRGNLMLSAMYAPLVVEGEAIGMVSIQAQHSHAYNDMDKLLLETLASYLAIAIKNAKHTKELAILNRKLKSLSELDGLTGIPNRRLFDETFANLWNDAMHKAQPLSMLFVDIDDFKDFNDLYGHLTGDEVLIKVAQYLQNNKEKEYFVARYGGDEFVMLLPNTSLKEATQYATNLRESIASIKHLEHLDASITVSIGLATKESYQEIQPEVFFKFVDQQLYESKNQGKNTVTSQSYTQS